MKPSSDLTNATNRLRGPSMITMRGAWSEPLEKTSNGLVHQCSACKKVKTISGKWEYRLIDTYNATHGYCPVCHQKEIHKIKAYIEERRIAKLIPIIEAEVVELCGV